MSLTPRPRPAALRRALALTGLSAALSAALLPGAAAAGAGTPAPSPISPRTAPAGAGTGAQSALVSGVRPDDTALQIPGIDGLAPIGMSAATPPSATPLSAEAPGASRYDSLSSALVGYYAQQSGQSIQNYLRTNGATLSAAYSAPGMGALRANSVQELNTELRNQGLGVGDAGFGHLDVLARRLDQRATSPDAQVVSAGAAYARALASLRTPTLTAPQASSSVDAAAFRSIPRTSLAFGLLLDKSLANTITSSPDLFAQIRAGGLGSPEGLASWNRSLAAATRAASADYSSALVAPCEAELFAVMGTGDPQAGRTLLHQKHQSTCGSCAAGGVYLHQQLSTILNPQATSLLSRGQGSTLPIQSLSSLPAYQRDAFAKANPDLVSQLSSQLQPNQDVSGCAAVSAGTTSALSATLPSFLSSLQR